MNFLIFIIILSILVVAHEFGHFLAARMNKVKVEKFAIGFGPVLFTRKGKQTDFVVCLFPLGGYVKLAGDNRYELKGADYEFLSKPVSAKIKIVFAGPLFNFCFALLLFWCIAMLGMTYRQIDPVIGSVKANSPAQSAGVLKGDEIVAISGKPVKAWDEVEKKIYNSKNAVELKVKRNDRIIVFDVPTVQDEILDEFGAKKKVYTIGISVYVPTTIGNLVENYPAQKAGIQEKDKVLSVNGKEVKQWEEMTDIIYNSKGPVILKIERNGKEFSFTVPCEQKEIIDENGKKKIISLIGVYPFVKTRMVKYNFFEAFIKGWEELWRISSVTIRGFGAMILGTLPLKDAVTGPLGIYKITADTVKLGLLPLINFMAILSVSLAIVNLLPLPLFDGGHILTFLVEKIRNKPLSEKADNLLTRIGFVLIGLIVVFVFYNDIVRFGPKIWGKWF
ncbi:MAG: RIP metalloprotease RseP [Candidatus Omnitrophica bacterium]|jgi:regulator of sigma E protease|nr:RIP metalloprotease RseP [Candidatus Omnitrophota bacterium]